MLADLPAVSDRLNKLGRVQELHNTIFEIKKEEEDYARTLISRMQSANLGNLETHVEMNGMVLKECLKVILSAILDDVWSTTGGHAEQLQQQHTLTKGRASQKSIRDQENDRQSTNLNNQKKVQASRKLKQFENHDTDSNKHLKPSSKGVVQERVQKTSEARSKSKPRNSTRNLPAPQAPPSPLLNAKIHQETVLEETQKQIQQPPNLPEVSQPIYQNKSTHQIAYNNQMQSQLEGKPVRSLQDCTNPNPSSDWKDRAAEHETKTGSMHGGILNQQMKQATGSPPHSPNTANSIKLPTHEDTPELGQESEISEPSSQVIRKPIVTLKSKLLGNTPPLDSEFLSKQDVGCSLPQAKREVEEFKGKNPENPGPGEYQSSSHPGYQNASASKLATFSKDRKKPLFDDQIDQDVPGPIYTPTVRYLSKSPLASHL